ncbi:hypothetical protein T01_4466 [Trichinella spiralis]|uniref:Uncharacterized protein n=1 Tax=Trichinella spiralis TaxID=6334 RepID=A0A0V1ASD2_TRISP|nr:hypothetical protein T01_4466 [Trichinella spiralis]
MTTRRCRSAGSSLRLYRPSGYYRPCRPFSLIHALLVTYSHSKQQNRKRIFIRNHNNDHHYLSQTTDYRSTATNNGHVPPYSFLIFKYRSAYGSFVLPHIRYLEKHSSG